MELILNLVYIYPAPPASASLPSTTNNIHNYQISTTQLHHWRRLGLTLVRTLRPVDEVYMSQFSGAY